MATWLGWNGPPEGRGSVDDVVSHTEPVVKALRHHAEAIGRVAAFNLDSRAQRRTGNSQVVVIHQGESFEGFVPELDSHILLSDPNTGHRAPAAIEIQFNVLGDAVEGAIRGAAVSK